MYPSISVICLQQSPPEISHAPEISNVLPEISVVGTPDFHRNSNLVGIEKLGPSFILCRYTMDLKKTTYMRSFSDRGRGHELGATLWEMFPDHDVKGPLLFPTKCMSVIV